MNSLRSLLVVAVLLPVVSCSKEKRLDRRLHRGSGKWTIERLTHAVYSNTNGDLLTSETTTDAGSVVFLKTRFTWGTARGTWERNGNELRLTTEAGQLSLYEIGDEEKKRMTLTNATSEDGYTNVVTMEMERE